ncbi:MAG: hypothetical protein KIT31_23600, partial [Deltaproteobacteria bacterium]|nr:hypothetical protein [Deltaproteobacteria bacterium]
MSAVADVFPADGPLAFRIRLGARWVATHWLSLVGKLPNQRLALESLVEVRAHDGPPVQRRAALVCEGSGRPLVYRTIEDGEARSHAFAGEHVEIAGPDGAFAIARDGAEFLADTYAPGLVAVMAAALRDRTPVRTARYHASFLAVAPCSVAREGARL